ncbi:DUF342 domain-containing protein [Tepidibacter formicigenes]|jgi:uncharacterized protein (DUF342 family)|uniref:Flagellar Assembly Protein A N-terminal region domain-containing protein n=1 Tax=Tepidibacter formicigenes DSM 15518 TaxID=1123349 RepID=A0A1M6LBM9_9FIRM|nr:FapA family protein [Tepidibacter formicigenes]SHJ68647.1 hypothetical protein SAMN02744037_00607 [Tepidibacter formicigenes DSM 15518]
MEIFTNNYFNIFEEKEKVYILVNCSGFNINDFSTLLKNYPRISIKHFLNLKNALDNGCKAPVEIGILKPKIEINISSDNMKASIKLNITNDEFQENKQIIMNEILSELESHNIVYGILYKVLNNELKVQEDILIAQGTAPINGKDAIIKYVQLPDRKPTIRDDGSANYYEMNLIYEVKKGDYLGEKIPATQGIPGKTIQNTLLPPKPGRDKLLHFDRKTVGEFKEGEKITLRALIDGAVSYDNGKISILNHLIIHGDVGYETGNIDFNGYVTIKGTVCDDFTVIADKDISIEGDLGIGAINKIISKNGDIYIKGGISGKGKAIIQAGKSVFVKYSNSCTINAEESINIGFYSIDSILSSKTIIVDPEKGRIIGGEINAYAKVVTNTIGNITERKTVVNVKGFDRKKIKKELDELLIQYKKCLIEIEKNKREMKIYENTVDDFNALKNIKEYIYYYNIHEKLMSQLSKLEQRRKTLLDYLESKGEGEVSILKSAYPQTFLEIKKLQKIIKKVTTGTFYAKDNKLHSE